MMSSSRLPKLYLDVDGVINPYLAPGDRPDTWPDFREGYAGRRAAVWSPTMLASIGRLPVEFVWSTTWGSSAEEAFGTHLGADRIRRVLDLHDVGLGSAGPKPTAIAKDLAAGPAPFIWIDDDAITVAATSQLARLGHPMLTIAPDRSIGLEPIHLDQMEAFLADRVGGR